MATNHNTPGPIIADARDRLGWRQGDLAERMKTTVQRVSAVERGREPVSLEWLLRAAEVLGIDPHTLDDRLASVKPARRKAKVD